MFLSQLRHSGFLPLCPWQISFVVVSVGLLPLSLFACCPLDGETQIWLGDLRLAFCSWCFVFWFMICLVSVLFDHSFFSCKDRALERDRPC